MYYKTNVIVFYDGENIADGLLIYVIDILLTL